MAHWDIVLFDINNLVRNISERRVWNGKGGEGSGRTVCRIQRYFVSFRILMIKKPVVGTCSIPQSVHHFFTFFIKKTYANPQLACELEFATADNSI